MSQDTIDSGHKTGCKKTQKDMETELDSLGDGELGQIPGGVFVSEDTTDTQADNEERISCKQDEVILQKKESCDYWAGGKVRDFVTGEIQHKNDHVVTCYKASAI